MFAKILLLVLPVLFTSSGCVSPTADHYRPGEPYQSPGSLTNMVPGQTVATGMIGASYLSEVDRSGGGSPPTSGGTDDLQQLPMLGGVFQHALWGERLDVGLEVGGTLGFSTGSIFVAAGGGGGTIVVDVDMFLFDLFGGPFISLPLGDQVRIYGGAGPLLQFASWDQSGQGADENGTGFGTGLYARTGVEFLFNPGLLVGIGARWSESRVSLGGGLGDLDLQGTQLMVTFTAGV